MRQTLLLLSLFVQMLFAPQPTWTQSNYPIYVSPTLLPPYSLKLSDYSAYGSQRMMVTIVVNDLEVANLPVKLRVKMETAGVTIDNPITINSTPIYIDGGSATVLFGEDLVDYFNINNLQFKGYSKETYRRSGQLPEGFYRFSVEVLHFHTNRVISNTGSVTAWIALGKPPVLRSPRNDVELGQYMGVPLTFSWLASNVGSPVSAGSIRYKYEMWEVRVKDVNPYTIVGSMPVFHDFVTSSTSYSFNPAAVMMEEGLTYAWRVTAFDESGLVPFEQNGQSEVRTFRYKSLCEDVQTVTAAASGQKGSFIWTPDRNHSSYNVEVRNTASDWFLANETFDSKVEFYELERGQTYEIRVQAVCNGNASSVSDYTAWTALTIPEAQPKDHTDECPDCGCSDDLPDVTLTNFELRQDLAPGDTLSNKTGATRFVVKSVEPQGDGIYKGVFYFWAEIWGVKIPCDFWDLQVNTDNVIVNMDYQSINDPRFLVDVDALIETGNEFMDNMAVLTTSTAIVDTIPVLEDFDYLVVQDGQLVAIVLNEDGDPIPTPLNITAEQAEKALITNEHGDEVVITSKGEVMGVKEYQATGGNSRLMQNYKEEKESNELSAGTMVTFAPHAAQKYGFDDYNEEKSALQHLYPTLLNGYRPAFKSVESFRYDKVGVDLTEGLTFRDEMGVPAIAMDGGVSVQGTQSGSNRAFYAYRALTDSTEELVGKLNVMSFDNAPKRVHIIPVNDAKIPSQIDLQTTLNRVYSQAIATWTVVPEAGVNVEFPGGRMTHEGAGSLSTYNKDQEAIVNAYVSSGRQMERNDLYLFYVKDATFKDRSLAGYMPLQRQVGFIYDNPTLEAVAHELGHGAFNLRHTFSPKAFLAPEGKTQNLMDYAGGTELWLEQWSLIQNPERVLFAWGQSEEEGAAYAKSRDDIWNLIINQIACANLNNKNQVRLDGLDSGLRGGFFSMPGIGQVRFNIPEMLVSENDYLIDLENVKISERTRDLEVDYKSVTGRSRLSFSIPIEQKDPFLTVLNSPTSSYFEELVNDIPTNESRTVYSLLSRLPECSYRMISTNNRIKYLEWLTGEFYVNEVQEVMIIDLLRYNDDKSGLFEALYNNPLLTSGLVSKCSGDKKQIALNELINLCNIAWSDKTPKGVIYTGKTSVEIGNQKHTADYLTSAKQINDNTSFEVLNYKGIFKGGANNIGRIQEFPPFVEFSCNLLDPVCVHIDDVPYVLPLILPAQLSEQLGNRALFNQIVASAVDVALLYGGVKLVSALAPEGKMIIDYLRITPKSFATLFLTDVGLQVTTNYLIDQNWANALGQVDLFDAAFTGAIGNIASIPIKGSQLLNMAKYGKQFSICRQITTNTSKVVTIEFTKIAFDYKLADNDFKTLCDNNEDYYDVMTKLILSLAAHYTAEEIHGFLKGWNNKVVESIEVEFDQIARPILLKVNEVVQTESFGKIIGAGTGVIAKFIEQINQEAAEVEYKIIEIGNIDKSINDIVNIKQDNTNVILPLTE